LDGVHEKRILKAMIDFTALEPAHAQQPAGPHGIEPHQPGVARVRHIGVPAWPRLGGSATTD
jgi:hypothetical protein